ncbi:hypothetical protein EXU57_13680 [Segetibacter sp. 3557_3]|uniref:hypothetical protein n=1 Tax=Segetibacter sp. 3557_3 TaxID=2547429 RepID=UPI0010583F01|nr:hypothetical protein [Segetibacter sp. 3557_3]TDH25155.1 hypothetical protein EXU57_13680 [Segetibacter sp. 3557_3]
MKKQLFFLLITLFISITGFSQVDSAQLRKSEKRIESDAKDTKRLDKKIERRERKINKQERRLKRQEHRRNKKLRSIDKEQRKIESTQQ